MQTVNIHEAKSQLSRLIEAVVNGEDVVIAKAGTPVVRLVPVEGKPKLRFGLMKGKIRIAKDFNAPLPADVLATFEGQ
ncbi:type II toxin-antitoxin system Phd/YefM family antitoxin [Paraburkholderia sp. GAS32]|uniref:type II toxin-antitoxin system Phd/YefM family antitoxin n=1 Tax=Paraburkholderia sp. GAS32 TaxID=3035129 RepID=UPI003D1FD1AC